MEQTSTEILSENDRLKEENEHFKLMLSIVRENIDLRARLSQLGETVEHSAVAGPSLSGRKIRQWCSTLDESQIRKDFQRHASVTHRQRVSSTINYRPRSLTQTAEVTAKPEAESAESDPLPEVKNAERILGEIAFQLDKRILSHIFPNQKRLYGFNMHNIKDKIIQVSAHPQTGEVDESYKLQLCQRYAELMEGLNQFGYNSKLHPMFSECIVNSYGILKLKPEEYNTETMANYSNPDFLEKVIKTAAPPKIQNNMLLLLSCLSYMSQKDGKLLFPL